MDVIGWMRAKQKRNSVFLNIICINHIYVTLVTVLDFFKTKLY